MLSGGLFMTVAGTALGEWSAPRVHARARSRSLPVSRRRRRGVAFAAYSYALRHLDIAIVSLYSYVNPVIAVALGTIFLGEPFHCQDARRSGDHRCVGVVVVGPVHQKPTERKR